MSLPPLSGVAPVGAPEKPRMTLDDFRQVVATENSRKIRETMNAMDAFQNAAARTGFGTSNLMEGTSYPFNRITLNYILLTSLYRGNWIIRKIVDTMADDMLKNWCTINTSMKPDQITRFKKEGLDATGTIAKLNKGIKLGRLYGGAGGVICVKGRDDFKTPLLPEEVGLGEYKGLLVFDRWSGISPDLTVSTDIDDPLNFGLPEYYQISTENSAILKVHHSRVIRFCGPDLPNWEWQSNMRWGASVVEAMFDELKKRDNTSWNIASLIFRANIMEYNSPQLESMLSGLGSNADATRRFFSSINAMTQIMSNQGMVITGKDQKMGSHSYSFAGIADVYVQFMLDICGSTDYSMSRLFGRSASGLSGTNEGDEHSYYELIKQRQSTDVNPMLHKLLPIVAMSVWGKVPKDFDWNWNPVNSLPDKERVELASNITTAVTEVFNAGVISQKTVLTELKEQSSVTGVWTNITDEMLDAADDTVMSPMEEMAVGLAGAAPGPGETAVGEPKAAKGNVGKLKGKSAQDAVWLEGAAYESANEALGRTLARYRKQAEGRPGALEVGGFDAALESDKPWEFQGLLIDIENLRGSVRHGASHHTRMTAPYGYIRNTEGADGDEVDCFVGPVLSAPYVYVVHTKNPETGSYDEDKVILGMESAAQAKELFEENYDRPGFFESMEKMKMEDFKRKLKTLRGRKIAKDSDNSGPEEVAELMEQRSFGEEAKGANWVEYSRGDARYGKYERTPWDDIPKEARGRWCRVNFENGEVRTVECWADGAHVTQTGWKGVQAFASARGD